MTDIHYTHRGYTSMRYNNSNNNNLFHGSNSFGPRQRTLEERIKGKRWKNLNPGLVQELRKKTYAGLIVDTKKGIQLQEITKGKIIEAYIQPRDLYARTAELNNEHMDNVQNGERRYRIIPLMKDVKDEHVEKRLLCTV